MDLVVQMGMCRLDVLRGTLKVTMVEWSVQRSSDAGHQDVHMILCENCEMPGQKLHRRKRKKAAQSQAWHSVAAGL